MILKISKITIKKLILPILKSAKINPNKKVNEITKSERDNLRRTLKSFDFTYVSNEKLDYAIISVGGVDVNEIDPSTMESKLVKDLYFCGEIIDVDGFTGGFNLQFAFSTGYLAGINI